MLFRRAVYSYLTLTLFSIETAINCSSVWSNSDSGLSIYIIPRVPWTLDMVEFSVTSLCGQRCFKLAQRGLRDLLKNLVDSQAGNRI